MTSLYFCRRPQFFLLIPWSHKITAVWNLSWLKLGRKETAQFYMANLSFWVLCHENVQRETRCSNNLLPKVFHEISNFPGYVLIFWRENIQLENMQLAVLNTMKIITVLLISVCGSFLISTEDTCSGRLSNDKQSQQYDIRHPHSDWGI